MRVPGFKIFFSLSLEASSSEDSLERFKSLAKSFSSPWEKNCGDKRDGGNRYPLGCYHCQLKLSPLHWKEKIPVVASLQKLEQDVIHCVELV